MILTTRYNRYAHGNIIGASAVPASAFARLLDEDGLDIQGKSPDFGLRALEQPRNIDAVGTADGYLADSQGHDFY